MDRANLKISHIVLVFFPHSKNLELIIIISNSKSIIISNSNVIIYVIFNHYSTCFNHGGNITDCDFHENL